jgi:hypothetical protein
MVFHSPQEGHLPTHWEVDWPQFLQKKADLVLAMRLNLVRKVMGFIAMDVQCDFFFCGVEAMAYFRDAELNHAF